MTVESVRRVSLTWPTSGSADGMPSLAEIETAFREWIDEARTRGCPDSAAVATFASFRAPITDPVLIVQWDAADDVPRLRAHAAGGAE